MIEVVVVCVDWNEVVCVVEMWLVFVFVFVFD